MFASNIAGREYSTDTGPTDYISFVYRKPAGAIEAKRKEKGHDITTVEPQTMGYSEAEIKYVDDAPPLICPPNEGEGDWAV